MKPLRCTSRYHISRNESLEDARIPLGLRAHSPSAVGHSLAVEYLPYSHLRPATCANTFPAKIR